MWSAAETPAQPQPGAEGLVISRTAPCLLPELQHVCDLPYPFLVIPRPFMVSHMQLSMLSRYQVCLGLLSFLGGAPQCPVKPPVLQPVSSRSKSFVLILFQSPGECLMGEEPARQRTCLQVAEVQVKGPRYWQQHVVADSEGVGPLGALYGRGALPVQLQRWALSYTQDPSGVRGLLSQAFDEVCAHVAFLCDKARMAL